jgi:hypothetical protein
LNLIVFKVLEGAGGGQEDIVAHLGIFLLLLNELETEKNNPKVNNRLVHISVLIAPQSN